MRNRTTLALIIIMILLIVGGFIGKGYYEGKINKNQQAHRSLVLRNDTLQKVTETQYRKLVADTLTKRELRKLIDSLGVALDAKPTTIIKTELVIKEVIKEVDAVTVKGDSIHVIDYYPTKENYFVRYQSDVSLSSQEGVSKFTFRPIDIAIVMSQREDGVFQADIKAPSFIKINSLDIQSLPMELYKPDSFGWIIGAGVAKVLDEDQTFFRINAGIRFHKLYVLLGGSSHGAVDLNVNFEF